jgi:predicted  nucleic acid-binding Zn-ribbon protein
MINYAGKNACFAIRNHPAKALADIRHLSDAVERLTAERAVLHQRVADLERELLEARAACAVEVARAVTP